MSAHCSNPHHAEPCPLPCPACELDCRTTVLVGAEGLTEIEGLSWWRHATDDESAAFIAGLELGPDANPLIDALGRPYWAIVVLPEAPAEAHDRAARYRRVVRLVE